MKTHIYLIVPGGDGRFNIDRLTGEVSTIGRLPFNCTEPYIMPISALTVGVPVGDHTPVQILTAYCQELDPQFYEDPYLVSMDELTLTDTV